MTRSFFLALEKKTQHQRQFETEILNTLSMQINFDLLSLLFFVNVMKEITSNLIEQIKKAGIIIAEDKRGFRNEF